MHHIGFPGQTPPNKMTVRAPVNPLDKSTIVSLLPKHIVERKATILPGIFEIPPGSPEKPALLVVGPSSWWRDIDETQPLLELVNSSIQVADAVVKDYCSASLGCDMNERMPGLFYVPGEYTRERLKVEYAPLIAKYTRVQRNWFLELVKIADVLWVRTNGNPLAIGDDARMACRELNISNKPWLSDIQAMELVRCVACGNMRNPQYPICPTCKAIVDPELAKKLSLTFAQ